MLACPKIQLNNSNLVCHILNSIGKGLNGAKEYNLGGSEHVLIIPRNKKEIPTKTAEIDHKGRNLNTIPNGNHNDNQSAGLRTSRKGV